jgi:hypothetical protein
MPAYTFGQTYNSGVKYIKINRYDSGGLDRSNYLSQLQSITLTYPDRSAIEYPINTIQEQANFYLYGITPGYNTSSKGDINDYSFLATSASTFPIPISTGSNYPADYYNRRVSSFGSIIGNTLGFFTSSIGSYTSGQTPNKFIKVQISGSGSITSGTPIVGFTIAKNINNVEIDGTNVFVVPGGSSYAGGNFDFTFYLTSSFKIIENDQIGFTITSLFGTLDIHKFYVSMSLYDTTPFNGSSSLVIFDPEAPNFDYNDYNPLLDNAEIPQYSTVWMDVDYSQNPLTPVNFELILSGTADRAYIQDSNYSSKSWSNLRYNGSRTNSYRITQ